MVRIEQLTEEEAQRLNSERGSAYWSLPIALTISLLLVTVLLN